MRRDFEAFWKKMQAALSPGISFDPSTMPSASTAAPISGQFVKRTM